MQTYPAQKHVEIDVIYWRSLAVKTKTITSWVKDRARSPKNANKSQAKEANCGWKAMPTSFIVCYLPRMAASQENIFCV